VARIPRETYLAPLGGYLVYKTYTVVAAAERRRLHPEYLLATVVVVQIVVLFTALLVAPSPRQADVFSPIRPVITLNYARLRSDGSIAVRGHSGQRWQPLSTPRLHHNGGERERAMQLQERNARGRGFPGCGSTLQPHRLP
jgi:hypothetical protein